MRSPLLPPTAVRLADPLHQVRQLEIAGQLRLLEGGRALAEIVLREGATRSFVILPVSRPDFIGE